VTQAPKEVKSPRSSHKRSEIVIEAVANREDLNANFFSVIDDKHVNQGLREFLTLEEQASFENAFFIIPEPKENLSKVLFVHTSVNCLNNLLKDVCKSDYGSSRDF
jgi:hypothetical protein